MKTGLFRGACCKQQCFEDSILQSASSWSVGRISYPNPGAPVLRCDGPHGSQRGDLMAFCDLAALMVRVSVPVLRNGLIKALDHLAVPVNQNDIESQERHNNAAQLRIKGFFSDLSQNLTELLFRPRRRKRGALRPRVAPPLTPQPQEMP